MLPPSPLTVRTCRFLAYGSSRESFAHGGVAVDDPGSWERVPLQEVMEPIPWESAPSPRQPLLPDNRLGVPAKSPKVARYAVVGIVAGESDKGTSPLCAVPIIVAEAGSRIAVHQRQARLLRRKLVIEKFAPPDPMHRTCRHSRSCQLPPHRHRS